MKRNLIVLLTILVCGLTACKPGQKKDGNMEKECENALQQITDVRYIEALEQEGIHKIIKYGVACYKKKCKVMMKIEG